MKKSRILAVVGPTAGGKTALSVELAKRAGGEVISCDSMQIYRGMDIGTAKPTEEEKQGVPHHLLDIAEPEEAFSVCDYVSAATAAADDILSRGKLPVFCGGTGLYLDAFLRGGVADSPAGDPALRAALSESAAADGGAALFEELRRCDPESAAVIHPNNLRRVIRAVEIYRLTGVPKSEWDRRSRTFPPRYDAVVLGLRYDDRALLRARISARVDEMLAAGLAEETRRLWEAGVFEKSPTAAAAIGYKELLPYLRGECTLAAAAQTLKIATAQYAKRQMTWFAAKDYVTWIPADEAGKVRKFEEIVNNAVAVCHARGIMI
mgnify:FL=1